MKDPITRKSRGFGFVTFMEVGSLGLAIKMRPHTVDDREVDAKRAVPRSEISSGAGIGGASNSSLAMVSGNYFERPSSSSKGSYVSQQQNQSHILRAQGETFHPYGNGSLQQHQQHQTNITRSSSANSKHLNLLPLNNQQQGSIMHANGPAPSTTKLFVGGLHYLTTTQSLMLYFRSFGAIHSAQVVFNRETRKSRGFGFVIFLSEEDVAKVIGFGEHSIHGKVVEIKVAVPKGEVSTTAGAEINESPPGSPISNGLHGRGIGLSDTGSDSDGSDSDSSDGSRKKKGKEEKQGSTHRQNGHSSSNTTLTGTQYQQQVTASTQQQQIQQQHQAWMASMSSLMPQQFGANMPLYDPSQALDPQQQLLLQQTYLIQQQMAVQQQLAAAVQRPPQQRASSTAKAALDVQLQQMQNNGFASDVSLAATLNIMSLANGLALEEQTDGSPRDSDSNVMSENDPVFGGIPYPSNFGGNSMFVQGGAGTVMQPIAPSNFGLVSPVGFNGWNGGGGGMAEIQQQMFQQQAQAAAQFAYFNAGSQSNTQLEGEELVPNDKKVEVISEKDIKKVEESDKPLKLSADDSD